MDQEKIGKFICELRKEKGYTQEQLAEKIYVTREAISKIERGKNLPSTDILLQLSKIFEVTINEILYAERKNKPIEQINPSRPESENKKRQFIIFTILELIIMIINIIFIDVAFILLDKELIKEFVILLILSLLNSVISGALNISFYVSSKNIKEKIIK